MAKESTPLPLELHPEKTLTFSWKDKQTVHKTTLKVKSKDNAYVIYKVKTTAPKRYVVRPPQGIVVPNGDSVITLTMVPKDTELLWTQAEASRGTQVKSDDKFMVQAAVVSADYYATHLEGENETARAAVLQQLWQEMVEEDKQREAGQRQVVSQRLTTRFDFPSEFHTAPSLTSAQAPAAGPDSSAPASADAIFSEHSALRKKYDDMVAYSVVLTGERDYLTGELDETKKRLERLEKEKKALESGESASTTTIQKKKEEAAAGFSFIQVVVLAIIAFIIGRLI